MMNEIIINDINSIFKNTKRLIKEKKIGSVLITGANGMIGSYLLMVFLKFSLKDDEPITIFALCRNESKARDKFKNVKGIERVKFLYQDVCDEINLKSNIDIIIHAASQASPKYYNIDPIGTMLANVEGTKKLLDFAVRNKSKEFIFISSSEIYGSIPDEFQPIDESTMGLVNTTNVRSCYAEGKRAGETLAISYMNQYGIGVKIVRPFHTYGPTMDYGDGRIFSLITEAVAEGKDIIFNSDGSTKRAFCYLTDAIEGLIYIITLGKLGEAYNLGNPEQEVSMKKLAEEVIKAFSDKNIGLFLDSIKSDNVYLLSQVTRNQPDVSKLVSLGWSPKISYLEGFTKCIESHINKSKK